MTFTQGFICSEGLCGGREYPLQKAQELAWGSCVDLQGHIVRDAMESVEERQEKAPSRTEHGALQKTASMTHLVKRIQQHEGTNYNNSGKDLNWLWDRSRGGGSRFEKAETVLCCLGHKILRRDSAHHKPTARLIVHGFINSDSLRVSQDTRIPPKLHLDSLAHEVLYPQSLR